MCETKCLRVNGETIKFGNRNPICAANPSTAAASAELAPGSVDTRSQCVVGTPPTGTHALYESALTEICETSGIAPRDVAVLSLEWPGTGGTWSYGPPPSSKVKKNAESFHDGLTIREFTIFAAASCPTRTDWPEPGCSSLLP